MKIGEVARETGLSVKTVRHYHDIGLVVASRNQNGYRAYGAEQLAQLRFVSRCRALGFTLNQCAALLALNRNDARTAAEVKALAAQQLSEIREQLQQLRAQEQQLTGLVGECVGDANPRCSILKRLNQSEL